MVVEAEGASMAARAAGETEPPPPLELEPPEEDGGVDTTGVGAIGVT